MAWQLLQAPHAALLAPAHTAHPVNLWTCQSLSSANTLLCLVSYPLFPERAAGDGGICLLSPQPFSGLLIAKSHGFFPLLQGLHHPGPVLGTEQAVG